MNGVAYARALRAHGAAAAVAMTLCCGFTVSAEAQSAQPADALGAAPAVDPGVADQMNGDDANTDEFEQADREEAGDDAAAQRSGTPPTDAPSAADPTTADPTTADPTAVSPSTGAGSLGTPTGAPATPTGYAQPGATAYTTPVFVMPTRPAPPRRVAPASLPNMLVIDPLSAAQGLLLLQYGRALSERWSLLVGPEYLIPGVLEDGVTGGGLIGSISFHLLRPAPAGLWFGPRFEFLILRDGPDDGLGYLIGAGAGYTWQWGHFTLSLGAGASYVKFMVNGRILVSEVLPTGRSALGFAF